MDQADGDAGGVQQAGRDHEAQAVEQGVLARRQLGAVGVAVEQAEQADQDRGRPARAAATRTAPPRPGRRPKARWRSRCPAACTPIRPRKPPTAMTSGKVTGRAQIAGRPSCAPQMPTATMAMMWSKPEIGCRKPLTKPMASPLTMCAEVICGSSRDRRGEQGCCEQDPGGATVVMQPTPNSSGPVLERPRRAEDADGVGGRQRRTAAASGSPSAGTSARSASTRAMKASWPISTPMLNSTSGDQQRAPLKPQRGQSAGEAHAVQQAEGEGDDPRMADGQAGAAALGADDLRREEQDGKRDQGVQQRQRQADQAEASRPPGSASGPR